MDTLLEVAPARRRLSATRSAKPKGEPFVWLTSLGLSAGLAMIFFVLAVVVVNGAAAFWPKRIAQIALGPEAETVLGKIVKIQKKSGSETREAQLFTGNREISGLAFRFIPLDRVKKISYPADIVSIERIEYGDAIGIPAAVIGAGRRLEFRDPLFPAALKRRIEETAARRAEIRKVEKNRIGAVNTKMEKLRLKEKSILKRSGSVAAESPELRRIKRDMAVLDKEFAFLAAEARSLREKQNESKFLYRLPSGDEKEISFGQIVSCHFPNRLTNLGRIRLFLSNVWGFVSGEPREANTEGGVFPALFGTFVMTVIMSAAVAPFGVLAAIYLREYAKQGILIRCVRIAVNNLAGVPSIVFGVFGLGFFVYTIGGSIDALFYRDALPTPTFGTGGVLWAALTLALMTVPVVIVATEEAISAVPRGMREGSLACGASKWQTIQRVVLPASAPGIITGIILAMARGAGEVAPLMLVGVVKLAPTLPLDGIFPFLHLERKFMHLGFHIYDLGFQSPDSEAARPMVFATTFLLIVLVVVMNLAAFRIRHELKRKYAVGAF